MGVGALGRRRQRRTTSPSILGACVSVTVDFNQAPVADPEVVGDLMEDNRSDLPAKRLRAVPAETGERAAVGRDLVRQRAAVLAVRKSAHIAREQG